MKVSKLGSMVAVLGLAGFASVACGDDDGGDGPVGGAAGSGGAAGAGGEPVVGGAGGAENGGAGAGAGGSGGAGASGGGAGGALGGEGGQSGAGGAAGGAACQYEDESYEVGQRFVTGGSSPELCTCEPSGEVTCLEQYDGCDVLLRDLRDVVDRAKTCDRDGPKEQCGVEATVKDFFCGPWWGLFTAEHVGELDAITELGTLSAALGCDASSTPCGDGPKPTESFCSEANRCEDRWTGQNQLENGGFELAAAGLPEKWSIVLADRPAYSLDSVAKSGVAALKLSVGQLGHEYEVSQSPSLGHRFIAPGSGLLVTGHYRIDALGGDVSFAVRMGNADYPIPAPTEAGVWKEFRVTTYATAQYRFTLGLVVQQDAGTLANVSFDDVQVELLP